MSLMFNEIYIYIYIYTRTVLKDYRDDKNKISFFLKKI